MAKNREKPRISQKTMRSEIERWKTETEKVKQPEIKAVPEGLEYTLFKEKFVDAKYNLEEFIDYLKSHNLKKGKEGAVKDLRARLIEMWDLLEKRNYENFKNKHNEFNDILEDLYPPTPLLGEEKKPDEKAKKVIMEPESKVIISSDYAEELAAERTASTARAAVTAAAEAPAPAPNPEPPQIILPPEQPPAPLRESARLLKVAKKGLWGRFKEHGKKITGAIFNRETGKVAGKVSYDTVASVLGIKLATDVVYGLATGKGDVAEWWKGRKESKGSREAITKAYEGLVESFQKVKKNKALKENEKIEERLADFKTQVESAHISSEEKKALLDRLWAITIKHQDDARTAIKERDDEVRRVLDAYVQGKISGMKIAKDAMNFALTAGGLSMLRGVIYAGVSTLERAGKARKKYAKETLGAGAKKAERELFVAKDVFVNSAIETARALTLRGEKKGAGTKTKIIDFIKAIGTVARGFGIYGLAFSHSELPSQSIDKLINGIKEHGVASTISNNFIQNAERAWHLYTHPTEVFKRQKGSTAPKATARHEVSAVPEHPAVAEPTHEAPVAAQERVDHTVAIEVLNNREGILHGVNKIIHDNPAVFTHADGKPWTENEIHIWKVHELKDVGFKFKGDKWGYPMTIHGGAKVEVFTDAQGQPHFKLASDEHVTFNKNYKWVDTEQHPAKAGAVESLNKNVNHAPIANADVVAEPTTAPKQIKVDLDIKEKAVVQHAPAAAPEMTARKETTSQFLKERGSNPKEFVAIYDKMVDATIDRFQDSFILRGDSAKFLQNKINALYDNTGITYKNITSSNLADSRSLTMMEKILDTEAKFKFNQPDWMKTFGQTMFDKSDKAIRLALAPDRDVLLEPIKTNGGHAARIWDPTEGKDVFIYNKDRVFNTNDDGRLIMEDEHGVTKLFNQKQALKMSEKELSE